MSNNVIVRSASFEASGLEAPQCYCHLDAVWRKVAKEGNNYGRHFWGCSRFGFRQRCQFFQWVEENLPTMDNRGLDKIKLAAAVLYNHNVSPSQTPTKNVDGSGKENGNECGNEDEDGNPNEDGNVNGSDTSPANDQNCRSRLVRLQSEDSFTTVMGEDESPLLFGCNLENTKTPLASPCNDPTILDASPQRPKKKYKYYKTCESPNSSKYVNDLKRRRDALETPPDNGIPRFTTPELLEVIENHMNQQDRFGYRQELSKELAREENRKLRMKMDQLTEDMNYMRREIQLLKHEKKVLELDLDVTQQELKDIKRRRHS